MKKIIFCWALFLLGIGCREAFGQKGYCGTPGTFPDLLQKISSGQRMLASNNYVVRIYVHIIRRSNGTGGHSFTDVDQAINYLVTNLEPHGICISVLGIDEIFNDTYYNFGPFSIAIDNNGDGKFDNFSPNSHANAIDIYLFPEDGGMDSGLASGIPGTAVAVGGSLFGSNLAISRVLSHEVGHCIGLFHTFHGLCEGGSCSELVNGSNCTSCGDFVCDTPADPQLFENNGSCLWSGIDCGVGSTDGNGDPYDPRMDLIMAYITPDCMALFTTGQGDRMRDFLANSLLLQNIIVPNSLTISSLSVGSGNTLLYDVLNDITAQTSVEVNAGGSLTLRAGESVKMKNHFHAKPSSYFHAYIDVACSTVEPNAAKPAKPVTKNDTRKPTLPSNEPYMNVYPNPAGNRATISIVPRNAGNIRVSLIGIDGSVVRSVQVASLVKQRQTIDLDLSGLPAGIYLIRVVDGTVISSRKLVKVN